MRAWQSILAGLLAIAPVPSGQASELRVGFTQDAVTLDPANHRKRETETIIRTMCDGLLGRDADMKVVPEIAQSYRQIDATTWEFRIRPQVLFHSGAALTAADVKFTFDRLIKDGALDGQTSPRKSLLGPLIAVEAPDSSTVRFRLASPWPILPAMLPFQELVSKAFVDKVGSAGLATRVECAGPFRLVDWRRGDAIIMERHAGYYAAAAPPAVDRVIYRIVPENASRVAALLSGDVDIVNELPASAIKQVTASARASVMAVDGTRTFFVALNLARKPFDDARVRRALNHAVNRRLLIDKVLGGAATPLNGVMSPAAFAFDAELPEYAYDPAKAKALLAEAGYAQGIDVTIDAEAAFKEQAEAVAALLRRVGVAARVQVWEGAVLTPIWRDAAKRRDRDAYFTSWGNAALDPSDIMVPTLRTGGRGNSAGYSNARVDMLLDAAETESDADKRRSMYIEAQGIVSAEAPWIFLWVPQDVYGVAKRVGGFRPAADGRINLLAASVR